MKSTSALIFVTEYCVLLYGTKQHKPTHTNYRKGILEEKCMLWAKSFLESCRHWLLKLFFYFESEKQLSQILLEQPYRNGINSFFYNTALKKM